MRCGGTDEDNADLNGCRREFPFATAEAQLCVLCKKINDKAITDDQKMTYRAMPQCGGCGVIGRGIPDLCARCQGTERTLRGEVDLEKQATAEGRSAAMQKITHSTHPIHPRTPSGSGQAHISSGATQMPPAPLGDSQTHNMYMAYGGPHANFFSPTAFPGSTSTAALFAPSHGVGSTSSPADLMKVKSMQRSSTSSKEHVMHVYWKGADMGRGKKITPNDYLGSGAIVVSGSETVCDIVGVRILGLLNESFLKEGGGRDSPLQPDEIFPRFFNKNRLDPDTDTMTVSEFYRHYAHKTHSENYIPVSTKATQYGTRGTYICLLVVVDRDKYTARIEAYEDDLGTMSSLRSTAGRKRTVSQSAPTSVAKRRISGQHGSTLLQSTFVPDTGLGTHSKFNTSSDGSRVDFTRITYTVDAETSFPNMARSSELETGVLDKSPMVLPPITRGKSKEVHRFAINGQMHVAKKIVNVGTNRSISNDTARHYLCADLIRLHRLQHFATQFRELAAEKDVEIAPFLVTEAFIAMITLPGEVDETPFLVEPLRASVVVQKYSGTLTTTTDRSPLISTIMALSHFVIHTTAAQFAFADLQGLMDRVDGKSIRVLFDPMSHSICGGTGSGVDGDTGLGDHGAAGIKAIIEGHRCNHICHALALADINTLLDTLEHAMGDCARTQNGEDGESGSIKGPADDTPEDE
ncbi:kinase-like domain-containing protein [Schizophyllum amplum]|uniref:Kinase-like domain-containing protein n=1 Tax=Schizophyllum amplum TaxID=97359 RepID=A0A550CNV5_9AGAR|nr:kinase-like domain-containing protein [Auriculariopsis ampla]